MASPSTILDATILCRRTFKSATGYSRLMKDEWAENRLADFKLWAKGAGALAPGGASLDHRLSSNEETHSIILNLLLMLAMLVEDCMNVATGSDHTALGVESGLSDAELTSMRDVDDNLSQLTRILIAVRKSGTRSRLEKADATFDPLSLPSRAFRRHLELLLLLRPGQEHTATSILEEFNQARLTAIQLRLIEANLRRRNRFLYAQKHAEKLSLRTRARIDTPVRVEGPVARSLTSSQRPPTISGEATLTKDSVTDELVTQSATMATVLDHPVVLPPRETAPQAATTVLSVTTSRISYPAPPPIRNNQGIFRCPCCCQSLPTTIGQGRQWKKHLMGDVFPYTCILPDCPQPLRLYLSKESWIGHMANDHEGSSQWACQLCSQKSIYLTFKESNELAIHLREKHSKGIKKSTQIPTLISAWERRIPLQILRCPICDFQDNEPGVALDHIAEHIHVFALRSLPWPPNEDSYGEDDDSDNDDLDYFKRYPYFDTNSSRSAMSSNSSVSSSERTDVESRESPDFDSQKRLTEETLREITQQTTKHEDTSGWLEILGTDISAPSSTLAHATSHHDKEVYRNSFREYFIPAEGINRQVIQTDLCRYLGNDALVKPAYRNGRDGYIIRAQSYLSSEAIATLKQDSMKWEPVTPEDQMPRLSIQELEVGRPEATTIESFHGRAFFPGPVRQYVYRAFEAESERVELSGSALSDRLKSIITNAIAHNTLDSTDWELLPLPQSTRWDGLWDKESTDEDVMRLLRRYTNEYS